MSLFVPNSWGGVMAPLYEACSSGGLGFEDLFVGTNIPRKDLDDVQVLPEWGRSRMTGYNMDATQGPVFRAEEFPLRGPPQGHKNGWTYYIKGQVLNESGVPLTSWVSLRVYYSATEALLYELEADGLRDPVVDTEGRFMLGVPDNTSAFYIVVHTVGPERAGSSSRTLTGSLPT